MDSSPVLPDWIAAEIAAGRTRLQPMIDSSPFDPAALRTVAGTGDFRLVDGHVRRVDEPGGDTWFPQDEPRLEPAGGGRWALGVTVTAQMLDDAPVLLPRAVGALLEVPRLSTRSLHSRLGPQAVAMAQEEVRTASVRRFLQELGLGVGDRARLVFDPVGDFEVTA